VTSSSSGTARSKSEPTARVPRERPLPPEFAAAHDAVADSGSPATLDALLEKLNPEAKKAIVGGILAALTGSPAPPSPLTVDDVEDDQYDVVIRPGKFVTLRRADPLTMFMTGALNSSLSAAVDRAHERLNSFNEANPTAILDMPQDDKDELMAVMREYACAICISPEFTIDKEAEPSKSDVRKLSMNELLTIFNAVPSGLRFPRLQGVQADTFRAGVVPANATAPSSVEDVPREAIRHARVNGTEVEVIGA
jgi:hypothetical protein